MSEFINTIDVIGDDALIDGIINRTISEISDDVVRNIGISAFYGCKLLTKVDFQLAETINARAFSGCTELIDVNLPSAKNLSTGVFTSCEKLIYTNLPSVVKIDENCFQNCIGLTSIKLPKVTFLGTRSFSSCTNLKTVDFHVLKKMEKIAPFSGCSSLSTLILRSETMCVASYTSPLGTCGISLGTGYIYVPSALVASYQADTKWSTYASQFRALEDYTVDGTITGELDESKVHPSIARDFIYRTISGECENDKITSIGDYAFRSCSSLTSVDFPLVTSIGSSAFYECSSLISVNMPLVTKLDNYTFYSCSSLTSVDFPLVTKVGIRAFQNCSNLTSVNLPLVTGIEDYTFDACSSLTSIDFPSAIMVKTEAFQNCSNLTSADFTAVTDISSKAFRKCSKLTSLILRKNAVCTLNYTSAFTSTPIASGTGYIYVPSALVDSYKAATNWSTYANQFRAIEDYPDICGGNE